MGSLRLIPISQRGCDAPSDSIGMSDTVGRRATSFESEHRSTGRRRRVELRLSRRQSMYLDRIAKNIYGAKGAGSRSRLIRTLIDMMAAANIDLTEADSEVQMRVIIESALRR
jgi:hypothetical protein